MGFNACPCMSSRTGANIVAILEIMSYTTSFVFALILAASMQQVHSDSDFSDDHDVNVIFNFAFAVIVVVLVMSALGLLFTIMLIVGIHKGSRKMMVAWMVMEFMNIVMKCLMTRSPSNVESGRLSSSPGYQVISLLVRIYFLAVVYTHYSELRQQERPAYFTTTIEMGPTGIPGQGHQGLGQLHIGPGPDHDSELGYGFGGTPSTQYQQQSMGLPPSYESCVQKN